MRETELSKPILIGFAGVSGVGKSTAISLVVPLMQKHFAMEAKHMAFSDALKAMLDAGFPGMFEGYGREDPLPWAGGKTRREMEQTLGTEWGRELVFPSLWVDMTLARAFEAIESGSSVLIDGVRFPEEADRIREAGGHIWHIHRLKAHSVPAHKSEGYDLFIPGDRIITNDVGIGDLYLKVHRALCDTVGGA